jgi:hypothetical protein
MKKKLVPVQFPPNIMEMLDNWGSCPEENVGWCLLCDGPIRSAQDLIENTNTHNCPEGLRLESRLNRPRVWGGQLPLRLAGDRVHADNQADGLHNNIRGKSVRCGNLPRGNVTLGPQCFIQLCRTQQHVLQAAAHLLGIQRLLAHHGVGGERWTPM